MASYPGITRAGRYLVVLVLLGSTWLMGGSGNGAEASALAVPLAPQASVSVCGSVSGYVPATLVTAGSITIGGQTFAIAPGAVLTGVAVLLGSSLCMSAQLNANGQIQNGTFSLDTTTSVTVCGTLTSYTAATALTPGAMTIGGQPFVIASGTSLSGDTSVGAVVSATLTLNSAGAVVGGSLSPGGCATNTSVPTATNTTLPTATETAAPTATSTDVPSPDATVTSTDTASTPTATATEGAAATATSTAGGADPTSTSTVGGVAVTPTSVSDGGHGPTATTAPTSTGGGPLPTSTSSGENRATSTPTGSSATSTPVGPDNSTTPVPPTAGPQATATAAPTATSGSSAGDTPSMTEYVLPGTVSGTQRGRGPWQFARDPHGNIWFTEYLAGGLGEILAKTHTLHEYRLHGSHTYPMGIASDHAGHIWVVERAGNRIDRLALHKGHATLTSWQLPHAYSGPQEIALGAHGGFWITERASRVAYFNPATRRLSEYPLSRGLQPYGITVNRHGPTFVNENVNLQSWATVTKSGNLQLRVKGLPWQASDPTLVAPTSSGSYVAMPMADGFARVHRPNQVSATLRPSTVTLKATSQPRALTSTRLTPFDSSVRVVTRTARRTAHSGSVLWRLPPHPGRPFDVKVDPRGKQVWLSEQRVPIVAATVLKTHRITDYVLSRQNAGLRGILATKRSTGTRVWVAEFYANRIGLLNTP